MDTFQSKRQFLTTGYGQGDSDSKRRRSSPLSPSSASNIAQSDGAEETRFNSPFDASIYNGTTSSLRPSDSGVEEGEDASPYVLTWDGCDEDVVMENEEEPVEPEVCFGMVC